MDKPPTPPWRLPRSPVSGSASPCHHSAPMQSPVAAHGASPFPVPKQSLEAAIAGSVQSLHDTLVDCQAHLLGQLNMQLRARVLPIPPPPSTPCPVRVPPPPPPPLPSLPRTGKAGKPIPPKSRPKSSWEWRDHDKASGTPAAERRSRKCKTVEGRERFCEEQRLRSDQRLRAKLHALPADPIDDYFPCEDSDSDGGDHVIVDPYMRVEVPQSLNKRARLIATMSKVVNDDGGAIESSGARGSAEPSF